MSGSRNPLSVATPGADPANPLSQISRRIGPVAAQVRGVGTPVPTGVSPPPGAPPPAPPPQMVAAAPAANDPRLQRYAGLPLTAEMLGIPGLLDRVSTRIPTGTGPAGTAREDAAHRSATLRTDLAASAEVPAMHGKNAQAVARLPGVRIDPGASPEEAYRAFVDHVKQNLLWLHDNAPEVVRQRAKYWYDGMQRIGHDWARQYGLDPRQTIGAIAALSPGTEWNLNVEQARRMIEIQQGQAARPPTADMIADAVRIGQDQLGRESRQAQKYGRDLMEFARKYQNTPLEKITDPLDRAIYMRLYDARENPHESMPNWAPEGVQHGLARTETGKIQSFSMGTMEDMAKAAAILQNPDIEHISRNLGMAHKVRNFYNNGIAPHAPFGDTTIDTHAVNGALLMPLGQSDDIVAGGMGSAKGVSQSDLTGMRGLYGAYADAYREAAKERGIQPRQMQSITWEALRGLYSPSFKRNVKKSALIGQLWNDHQAGKTHIDDVRQGILRIAGDERGGIPAPSWSLPPT